MTTTKRKNSGGASPSVGEFLPWNHPLRAHAEETVRRYHDYAQTHLPSDSSRYLAELFVEFHQTYLPPLSAAVGPGVWSPIETAPKGGGAERTDDPKWIEPPKLLMAFEDGTIEVCHWDWYYAPGGHGYSEGVAAWIGANGEQVSRFQGDPVAWMPLPSSPKVR